MSGNLLEGVKLMEMEVVLEDLWLRGGIAVHVGAARKRDEDPAVYAERNDASKIRHGKSRKFIQVTPWVSK